MSNSQDDAGVPFQQWPDYTPHHGRLTHNAMTKYEETRLLGTIATNLHIGQHLPLVKMKTADEDPLTIAQRMLHQGQVPAMVRRHFPDGTWEDWPIHELHQTLRCAADPPESQAAAADTTDGSNQ